MFAWMKLFAFRIRNRFLTTFYFKNLTELYVELRQFYFLREYKVSMKYLHLIFICKHFTQFIVFFYCMDFQEKYWRKFIILTKKNLKKVSDASNDARELIPIETKCLIKALEATVLAWTFFFLSFFRRLLLVKFTIL